MPTRYITKVYIFRITERIYNVFKLKDRNWINLGEEKQQNGIREPLPERSFRGGNKIDHLTERNGNEHDKVDLCRI